MYSYIVKNACKGNHSGRPHCHFVPGFRFLCVVDSQRVVAFRLVIFAGNENWDENNAFLEISHSKLYVPKKLWCLLTLSMSATCTEQCVKVEFCPASTPPIDFST